MVTNQRRHVRKQLQQEVSSWIEVLEDALLKVENNRRVASNFVKYPSDTEVWIPQSFQLLTLKVWCLRYCVSPMYVLDVVTSLYKNQRRYDKQGKSLLLGIPVNIITSIRTRKFIEEKIIKDFPGGENFLSASQIPQKEPIRAIRYETTAEFLKKYEEIILQRRKHRPRKITYHRVFRKPSRLISSM